MSFFAGLGKALMGVFVEKPLEARVLMIGLDGSGKTALLYRMKIGEAVTTIPTIGFNVETVDFGSPQVKFTIWDVGGQPKIRPLWRHYYNETKAIIWVIDSYDRARLHSRFSGDKTEHEDGNVPAQLSRALQQDELKGTPVLIIANKQDISGAVTPMEIKELFASECKELADREWEVFGISAHAPFAPAAPGAPTGSHEAVSWLHNIFARQVLEKRRQRAAEAEARRRVTEEKKQTDALIAAAIASAQADVNRQRTELEAAAATTTTAAAAAPATTTTAAATPAATTPTTPAAEGAGAAAAPTTLTPTVPAETASSSSFSAATPTAPPATA